MALARDLPVGGWDEQEPVGVRPPRTLYHALQALGVAKERMRLFAVTIANGQRHMILVADGWVLDNLEPRLEPEAKARRYYRDWEDRTNTIVIK